MKAERERERREEREKKETKNREYSHESKKGDPVQFSARE